jgi:hypothetical protein
MGRQLLEPFFGFRAIVVFVFHFILMSKSKKRNTHQSRQHHTPAPDSGGKGEQPPTDPPTVAEVEPSPEGKPERTYCKPDKTPLWKSVLKLIAFAIGIYGVIIYKGQWQAALDANQLSSDNFKRAQRAWVNANFQTPVFNLGDSTTPFGYSFMVHNYGTSPALNVRVTEMFGEVFTPHPNFTQIQATINSLTPDEANSVSIFNGQELPITKSKKIGGGILTPQEREGLANRSIVIVVGGKIFYSDIFTKPNEKPHETTYCIYYSPPATSHPNGSWNGCPTNQIAT